MVQQRLLGIWKYDDDIGYLCGEIEEILENGRIKVKGYNGYVFEPIRIIPYDEKYREILEELRCSLRREKADAVIKHKTEFEKLVGIKM